MNIRKVERTEISFLQAACHVAEAVRKTSFWCHFHRLYNRSFCQDRLGTNIRKRGLKRPFFSQEWRVAGWLEREGLAHDIYAESQVRKRRRRKTPFRFLSRPFLLLQEKRNDALPRQARETNRTEQLPL
jgi:hypothetical protein